MLREVTLFELKRVAFIFLVCIWGMNDPDIIIIIVLVNDDLAMVPDTYSTFMVFSVRDTNNLIIIRSSTNKLKLTFLKNI